MKTLILLRHAQSEPGRADHERALTASGRADAATAGAALHAAGLCPDFALVSDSRRTRETCEGVMATLGTIAHVATEPDLYDASWPTILHLIQAVPEDVECLLVVGHNPGIGETARNLVTAGSDQDLAALRRGFPTSGSAVIVFAVSQWTAIEGGGVLESLLWPGVDDRTA